MRETMKTYPPARKSRRNDETRKGPETPVWGRQKETFGKENKAKENDGNWNRKEESCESSIGSEIRNQDQNR